MTKAELISLLAPFDDDQYVYVQLNNKDAMFTKVQIIIQGVESVPPWHPGPKNLIGLVCDLHNSDLRLMNA